MLLNDTMRYEMYDVYEAFRWNRLPELMERDLPLWKESIRPVTEDYLDFSFWYGERQFVMILHRSDDMEIIETYVVDMDGESHWNQRIRVHHDEQSLNSLMELFSRIADIMVADQN